MTRHNRNRFKARAIAAGYRSGLEESIKEQTNQAGIDVAYEPFKIPWVLPEQKKKYTPDFVLPNGIVIESKGVFTVDDRKKHLFLQAQYPDLDLRFVFSRSKSKLRKGAKSTYADWCEKHGFKYADKLIPEEWLQEPTNKPSLKSIESFS